MSHQLGKSHDDSVHRRVTGATSRHSRQSRVELSEPFPHINQCVLTVSPEAVSPVLGPELSTLITAVPGHGARPGDPPW